MSRTLLIGGFAVVALAAAAGVATARQPVEEPAAQAMAVTGPVSRADFVERRLERLAAADVDGDGTVTREERRARADAARARRAETRFTRLDTDQDGKLSREEFVTRAERAAAEGRPDRARRGHDRHGEGGPVEIATVRARAEQAFT
ncbi:MAG: EF-hand domain-containing protein, partial [Brevundimonas sp.]